MFAKRKGNEGFEWHKYVRTTIKLRREQRREKVREAGRAAGAQVGAAGVSLVAGGKAAGSALVSGGKAAGGMLGLLLLGLWNVIVIASLHAADKAGLGLMALGGFLARVMRPVIEVLSRPRVGAGVALAAALALGAGFSRSRSAGFDRETMLTLVVAGLLVLATLPVASRSLDFRMPRLPAVSLNPRVVGGGILALLVAAGAFFGLRQGGGSLSLASLPAKLPLIGSEPLQGRVQVLGGDRLRIGSTTVRLSGIELPEVAQMCGKPGGRQFRCGGLGAQGLQRVIGGAAITCTRDGSDSEGVTLARCMRGDREVNGELVRQGIAFAESGLVMTRYSAQEKEARAAKAGIWAAGDTLRPAEWRTKMWDDAKRKAPDGCPIKGVVMGSTKLYLLPWSPEYERGRIQPNRGERWFCSESEAVNAGWKAAPLRG